MARFGRNEQLVIAGTAAVLAAWVLGLLTQGWTLELDGWVIVVSAIVALALTFMAAAAPGILGVRPTSLVRIAAALIAAFALVKFGDLLSSLDSWGMADIILTIVHAAGAAILAYGAWAVSGGNLWPMPGRALAS